ncbi:MAG: WG repeat-containing protein [Bacteroidaceae bacterium]|nr:WG repeat-containing protein [Bacteroidaceae bacterium]
MKNLILFLSVLLVLASCGDKNAQTKDSATSDTTAAKQTPSQESEAIAEEDDYDLEAIAKVIEGCEDLGSFSHGLAGVKKDDKVGYIDKKGRTVIPFEYDGPIQDFFDGIVTVFKGDDNIYMDPTGKELFRTQRFGRFNDGLSQERSENGLIGFKDKTGKVVIPAQFDYAGEFSDGMCWVTKPGSDDIGYIDTTGKLVVPCLYAWPPERSPTDFHEGL